MRREVLKPIPRMLLGALLASAAFAPAVRAEDPPPQVAPEDLKKVEEIMEKTKGMGPWERQYQVIEQATDRFFESQKWNSEPDHFTRDLMREVSRIPPWQPIQRQEAFLNGVQTRLQLTHDQRNKLNSEMHREAMMLTLKYFKDAAPVALEIARTRAADQPFTAEQVQSWTTRLGPMMEESLQAIERVGEKLEKTMTPDQRDRLNEDLRAFRRRHQDVERLMKRWQAGKWSPADWGLQDDPIHASAIAQHDAENHQRDALVRAAQTKRMPEEMRIALDESAWDQYVKWFCATYDCTELQRGQADTILKSSKREAIAYHSARRDLIEKAQTRIRAAASPEAAKKAVADLAALQKPIGDIFERLKKRLHEEVLTTRQRALIAPPATAQKPSDDPKP
jgi:hypothetical protein